MEFKASDICRYEVVSGKELCKMKGGLSPQALDYARKHNKVDFFKIGGYMYVYILTAKTKAYKPNSFERA